MNGTKDFAFAQELSIEDRTKKEMHCVLLKQHECSVSRGLPLGNDCRYTDAAACNDDENVVLCSRQNARSARRRMTMRRPQKNGGTEVETFFLGVARDARCDQRRQEKPGPDKGGRLAVSGKNFWRPCTLN